MCPCTRTLQLRRHFINNIIIEEDEDKQEEEGKPEEEEEGEAKRSGRNRRSSSKRRRSKQAIANSNSNIAGGAGTAGTRPKASSSRIDEDDGDVGADEEEAYTLCRILCILRELCFVSVSCASFSLDCVLYAVILLSLTFLLFFC